MNPPGKYNPRLHHRRSIRLKGYDYAGTGLYFITVCVHNRQCLFGEIQNGAMHFNEWGTIAHGQWEKIHERFSGIELDVFQIMPNHLHAIVHIIGGGVGAPLAGAPDADAAATNGAGVNPAPTPPDGDASDIIAGVWCDGARNDDGAGTNNGGAKNHSPTPAATVGNIIGAYKSLVANACLQSFKSKWAGANPVPTMGKLWQRNYYEHIIRTEADYHRIAQYIRNNPSNWKQDKFFFA